MNRTDAVVILNRSRFFRDGNRAMQAGMLLLVGCSSAFGQLKWEQRQIEVRATLHQTNAAAAFAFRNIGGNAVTISSVKTSCGSCTTADLPKKTWLAGEKGRIVVNFHFGVRTGLQEQTILVQSNDPKESSAVLTLRVHIPELVKITPLCLFWQPGEAKTAKFIAVKVVHESPIKLANVRSNNDRMIAKLKTKQEGWDYQIEVTPADTAQPMMAILRIESDGPAKNSKVFHAYAQVRPAMGLAGLPMLPFATTNAPVAKRK